MHQLKKMAAIGGAVALVLCWPFAVGHIGQKVIEDGIEHLDSDTVSAEVVRYDRGYLSSQVETRYRVNDPVLKEQLELDGLPTDFVVASDIQHGLFSLSAESVMVNYPDFPLLLNTVTQLNGNTDYDFTLGSWSYQGNESQNVDFSISPASASGTVTVLGQVSIDATIPSIQLDFENGEQLLVSDLSISGDGKKEQGFWLGEQQASMKNFRIVNQQHTSIFDIDTASYTFKSTLDTELDRIDTQHLFDLKALTYPEGGELSDLKVDFSLKSLDRTAFEGLVGIYQSNPSLQHADINTLAPLIETLFARGFKVAMNDMHFTLQDGEFKSKWLVEIPEGTTNVSKDPSLIIPALTGNMDAYMSNAMIASHPMLSQGVDELVVMEMIEQQESGYQLKADIENGQLMFGNGQKIPLLALFLPLMMGQPGAQ